MDEIARRIRLVRLLDFYGPLLTEHMRTLTRMYCEEDLSFTEVAEALSEVDASITRQGVHDVVRRAEKQLIAYEEKLGFVDRDDRMRREVKTCLRALKSAVAGIEAATEAFRHMTEIER